MRVLLAVCIAVAWGEIASAREPAAIKGAGAASCAEYAKAYQMSPVQTDDLFLSWAVGYISGINFITGNMSGTSWDLAAETQNEMKRYLRQYCNDHPLADYATGVLELMRSLPTFKPTIKSKD
jgi:hypothetical protein